MNSIAAFALLSLILTVTPGPDSLLVLRSSLQAGRHAGTRVAGGAASGSLFWGLCSAAGLTAIMAASAQAFRAVQLAGAAYLIILGIRGWRSARPSLASGEERPGPGPGFRAGLVSNVLNPKVGLFFLAVMPQLIPRHADVAGYGLAFAVTDAVITGTWLLTVAWIRSASGRPAPGRRSPCLSRACPWRLSVAVTGTPCRVSFRDGSPNDSVKREHRL